MKLLFKIFILLFFFVIAFLIDLKSGSINYSFAEITNSLFNKNSSFQTYTILTQLRIPRIITAILVGIALPISGLLLQTLFKNPLSGPYIFGISSGASFGVALLLMGLSFIGIMTVPSSFSIAIAGIIGAGLVLLIIVFISFKVKDNLTILIVGVFLGSGIGAIVNLMQYFSSAQILKKFIIWTMGSLDAVIKEQLWWFSLIILSVFILTIIFAKYFDTLYLGDDNAKTLGVNTKTLRIFIFSATGILTGITTAFCGPIGFIGIAVPHLSRVIFRTSRHIELLIFSAIIGSIIMLISDAISHSFINQIIPINTITAIVGIPIIFWVIFRNKGF
ncbi:MAG: iron ABC transporter permease [Bacteroidales bacterium]|nr:iron ABC transporter permease [Bacteroidales bacterium]